MDVLPDDLDCLSIDELQKIAYDRMPKSVRDYYNEGADRNTTLRENITAYDKYRIRPRVLRDVSACDTTTTAFGRKVAFPLSVAPTAMQRMAHPDGEVATAKAAKKCNTMMGLSSFATASLEEVAEHHDNLVLQLYIFEERHHSEKLVMRAKKAGYKAVFLTVDTPVLGRRLADKRNKFKMPDHLKIANFVEIDDSEADAVLNGSTSKKTRRMRDSKGADIAFHTHAANATLTFENDIAWLKKLCGDEMQVWLKGIATPEDALLALQYGVDGIVVSNHGGRQADSALATLDALPDIVAAIRGRIPVHVDGGVRHGSQIFKAIALGADMVYIGRPVLWGLAYKGQAGVELALNLLYQEFKLTMALAGVTSISEISKEYLARLDRDGFISKL